MSRQGSSFRDFWTDWPRCVASGLAKAHGRAILPTRDNGADKEMAMDEPVWRRTEIDSPCVKICVIHPAEKICAGCYRTSDEIAAWSRMSPEARRAVMAELPGRAGLLKKRRGGRGARLSDRA